MPKSELVRTEQNSNSQNGQRQQQSSPTRSSIANIPTQAAATNDLHNIQQFLTMQEHRRRCKEQWSNNWWSLMPCVSSICGATCMIRIALQVILFRWPFIVQFTLLSSLLGLPFIALMIAVGHGLGSGVVEMWYISPIFKGIGLGLQVYYVLVAIYNVSAFSWIVSYLSDSIVKNTDDYKWSNCSEYAFPEECQPAVNCSKMNDIAMYTYSYLKYDVLENHLISLVSVKRCVSLLGIWAFIYSMLCRRVATFGRLATIVNSFNLLIFLIVVLRMSSSYGDGLREVFDGDWSGFMTDKWCWIRTLREVVLTWVVFGGITMQLSGHMKINMKLKRFVAALFGVILLMMVLTVIFALCLRHGLELHGVTFVPTVLRGSQENDTGVISLIYSSSCEPGYKPDTALQYVNYMVGDGFANLNQGRHYYHEMRVLTELFPTLAAVEGTSKVPSIMAFLLYFCFLGFAMTQMMTVWLCFEETMLQAKQGFLKNWTPMLSGFFCIFGVIIGLVFQTESSKILLYLMDVAFSSVWWICFLFGILAVVFVFRDVTSRNADQMLRYIAKSNKNYDIWCGIWGVFLPLCFLITMMLLMCDLQLSVAVVWTAWPTSFHAMNLFLQLIPIMIFFFTLAMQIHKFSGFRGTSIEKLRAMLFPRLPLVPVFANESGSTETNLKSVDPPPSYTPPPSYSAATGLSTARDLLRSFSTGQLESNLSQVRRTVGLAISRYSPVKQRDASDCFEKNQEVKQTSNEVEKPIDIDPPSYCKSQMENGAACYTNFTNSLPNTSSSYFIIEEVIGKKGTRYGLHISPCDNGDDDHKMRYAKNQAGSASKNDKIVHEDEDSHYKFAVYPSTSAGCNNYSNPKCHSFKSKLNELKNISERSGVALAECIGECDEHNREHFENSSAGIVQEDGQEHASNDKKYNRLSKKTGKTKSETEGESFQEGNPNPVPDESLKLRIDEQVICEENQEEFFVPMESISNSRGHRIQAINTDNVEVQIVVSDGQSVLKNCTPELHREPRECAIHLSNCETNDCKLIDNSDISKISTTSLDKKLLKDSLPTNHKDHEYTQDEAVETERIGFTETSTTKEASTVIQVETGNDIGSSTNIHQTSLMGYPKSLFKVGPRGKCRKISIRNIWSDEEHGEW